MSGILKLESLTKGNTLKQGDKTPLKYRLFDADGEQLNIAGKSARVRLVYPDFLTIGYEKDGLTVAQDDTVMFTIDKVIPAKLYHVEIIVDDQFIFPSREDESKFTVDKSSLGTEANVIEIVGVDAVARKATGMMKQDEKFIDDMTESVISDSKVQSFAQGIDAKATNALSLSESADMLSKSVQEQFNQVVIDGDSSVEAAQARVDASGQTNPTLKARLDKEHNKVTTQLAQTHANVMDFGAVGDGETDDTLAIQTALNTGKRVYFPDPPEEYIVSDSLFIEKNGQYVYGASKINTKIRQTNTEKDLFVVNAFDYTITSLYMIGNVSTTANRSAGVKLNRAVRGNVSNNTIRNFAFGVSSEDSDMSWINVIDKNNIEYCLLATVHLPKNGHGTRVTLNELRASKYGIVIGELKSDGSVNEAFNSVSAGSISIRDNTIEGNRDIDVVISNGNFSTTIEGNYFETAQNQNNKKWVIQVGTNGTARGIGVSINKNYFYTYPTYAENFPIIKLYRFSYLNISNNDSLSPNQVLIDNSEATGSGNVVESNNYVNGGRRISDINAAVSMRSSEYPLTKNGGQQKLIYQYDSSTSKDELALTIANRYGDGFTFHSTLRSKNKTVLEGEVHLPNKSFDTTTMGIRGGGDIAVNSSSGSVVSNQHYLVVSLAEDFTTSADGQILVYVHPYTDKNVLNLNDSQIGSVYNGDQEIKVFSRNNGFVIDTTTAGNYKLTGSFIVPLV